VGYRNLSADGVAARAGTSKAVLYRRWRNRAELVLAALRAERPMLSGPVPDTGSLRGDVLALLGRVQQGIEEIGIETLIGLLEELYEDPGVELFMRADKAGEETMAVILAAAERRGELDLARVTPRMATLPVDLVRHEMLVTRAPVADGVLVEIVDEIFLPLVRAAAPKAP